MTEDINPSQGKPGGVCYCLWWDNHRLQLLHIMVDQKTWSWTRIRDRITFKADLCLLSSHSSKMPQASKTVPPVDDHMLTTEVLMNHISNSNHA